MIDKGWAFILINRGGHNTWSDPNNFGFGSDRVVIETQLGVILQTRSGCYRVGFSEYPIGLKKTLTKAKLNTFHTHTQSHTHNHKHTNKETIENRLITHAHNHTTRNREPSSTNNQEPREKLTWWRPTTKSQQPWSAAPIPQSVAAIYCRLPRSAVVICYRDLLPLGPICCTKAEASNPISKFLPLWPEPN